MSKNHPYGLVVFLVLATILIAAWTRPPAGTSVYSSNRKVLEEEGDSGSADSLKMQEKTGRKLFLESCATCHGTDGTGAPQSQLGFDTRPADFTNCNFATREPNGDWIAVAHEGGPIRGFSRKMPAFGDALSDRQLKKIMGYIRTLCKDDSWPRGELNLPRPLVTEKAYPEDEAVVTTSINTEDRGAVMNELVYEQRIGSRNQMELVVPFGYREQANGRWSGGHLGDMAIGWKRVVYDDLSSGSILSVTGEVIIPSGAEASGFGGGTTKLEPFVSYGQILPAGGFLHAQAGMGVPVLRDKASDEAFWRAALGKRFTSGRWGRVWSPMVEFLGSREFGPEGETHWNIAPQMQVTLNKRQHIMLNIGASIPLKDPARTTRVKVYLLWDWFDGGLTQGW